MSDQVRQFRKVAADYYDFLTTRLKFEAIGYDASQYTRSAPFLLMSMVLVIALHDLFSMFLLRSTKTTCKLMAWGGVSKIVAVRWMLLIPAIVGSALITGFFATLALETCKPDDEGFCFLNFLNYKVIIPGIALGLFVMALFYAWKRRKEGSVEYLMIASLMDPNGDGRSKFLDECKKSKEFKDIMAKRNT